MMKKVSFSEKHPVIGSLLVTFVLLLVLFISGMVSAVTGVDSKVTFFAGFLIAAAAIVTYLFWKNDWKYYGFNSISSMENKDKTLFIPLFIMALLPLITGFTSDLTAGFILYVVIHMAIVAFVEETVFRGIILRMLHKKGTAYSVLGSCLLFSIPHIMNTLNGRNLVETIVQIVFAFVIGLILAMLVIKTNNIVLPIAYHFINNTVSTLTNSSINSTLSESLTFIVLIIGIIYLGLVYNNFKQILYPQEANQQIHG